MQLTPQATLTNRLQVQRQGQSWPIVRCAPCARARV